MPECLYKRGVRVPLLMAVDRYVYFTAPLHVSNFKSEFAVRSVRTATKLVSFLSRRFELRLTLFRDSNLASLIRGVVVNSHDDEERRIYPQTRVVTYLSTK